MSTRQHSRVIKAYDAYLAMAFQRALGAARQAGTSAFAATLMREAPTPPGEEAVSVCLDLALMTNDELRLLAAWEG